mgnify:CR=1 FL=1
MLQAETAAATAFLGREEWFEGARENLRRHAEAGVAHGDDDVTAGREVGAVLSALPTSCSRSARYSVPPRGIASRAFRARFRMAVSEFAGVDEYMGRLRFAIDADLDRLAERARQNRAELMQQLAWIDRLRIQTLAPRECQQFARQFRASPDRAQRAAENLLALRAIGRSGSSSCRLPEITVSMLLKSCATPPVNWPTASESLRMRELLFGAVALHGGGEQVRHGLQKVYFVAAERLRAARDGDQAPMGRARSNSGAATKSP